MPWLYATVAGSVLGLAMGYIAERLPIAPILQSMGAAVTAAVLGTLAVGLGFSLRPQAGSAELAVIGIGLETLLFLVGLGLCVAGLHNLLGRFRASAPMLALHRAVVLGCLGGLCGALLMAAAMVAFTRSN